MYSYMVSRILIESELIYLTYRPYLVIPHQVCESLGVMAMKGYSAMCKSLELEPHHQIKFNAMLWTPIFWVGRGLPVCRECTQHSLKLATKTKNTVDKVRNLTKNSVLISVFEHRNEFVFCLFVLLGVFVYFCCFFFTDHDEWRTFFG